MSEGWWATYDWSLRGHGTIGNWYRIIDWFERIMFISQSTIPCPSSSTHFWGYWGRLSGAAARPPALIAQSALTGVSSARGGGGSSSSNKCVGKEGGGGARREIHFNQWFIKWIILMCTATISFIHTAWVCSAEALQLEQIYVTQVGAVFGYQMIKTPFSPSLHTLIENWKQVLEPDLQRWYIVI